MKLTLLGTGTCVSQFPGVPNRYPPAFLVEWGKEKMLFDCSEGVRFRLEQAGYDYADIHHVAISHPHPDHCALVHFIQSVYVKGMWWKEKFKNEKLNIYCPDYIVEHFSDVWNFHLPERPEGRYEWPELLFHGMTKPEKQKQIIGNATLESRPVYHAFDKVDALCFRLETPEGIFAYSGDTGLSPGLIEVAENADVFVCDASARVADEENATTYGHLNPRQAAEVAGKAGVKKLIFFHYSGIDSDEAIIADARKSGFGGEIIVGKDFTSFAM